ncbi:MAG TPA: sulfotransferase [Rhizomicrobium sp.]|jgi:hypothetical protein
MARPFFIVSSGRSGTAMLQKALSQGPDVEIHHEYMVHVVQPLAVQRYMNWCSRDEAMAVLDRTHGAAVHYSEAAFWGDSSNKLSWLIPELAALFPQAKFVHLVRDGRKVAGSYFHKLAAECYDDRSTRILSAYAASPSRLRPPPPEKKYWWPLPRPDDPWEDVFAGFDQFARIAWHWAEINRVIVASLAALAPERSLFVRLEDLQASADEATRLARFLGLAPQEAHATLFARPHNVNRPEDRLLDTSQSAAFERIAAPMMHRLGYADRPEYVVKY